MKTSDHISVELNGRQLLGTKQLSTLLGCSVVHLRRLARSGKLPPPIKIGDRKLAWRSNDIASFIDAKCSPEVA